MADQLSRLLIRNARVFDGVHLELSRSDVAILGGKIERVKPDIADSPEVRVIDAAGKIVIPGLTDAHVHLMGAANTILAMETSNLGTLYATTIAEARRTLMRGFTTVRDMGGDMAGLRVAVDRGTIDGPRIYPSQAIVSQTSGHGDFSRSYDAPPSLGGPISRGDQIGFTRVVDGPDLVLAAVREQLKRGATQVKLAAGGGVSSLFDPLYTRQFTSEELTAAVRAASDYGTYVAVHVYNDEGVQRAVESGVRSIEHAHLISEDIVRYLSEHGVWLSTQPWQEDDHEFSDPVNATKNREVSEGSERLILWAREHGVKTAFGTDVLFEPHATDRQINMLARLGRMLSPLEALRMATSTNAELFRMAGERDPYREAPLGVIEEGAWADLLVVEGDPTASLDFLVDYEKNLSVIVKDGRVVKNLLGFTS